MLNSKMTRIKCSLIIFVAIFVFRSEAWPATKTAYELDAVPLPFDVVPIKDCMHVASEEGDYIFQKLPHLHGPAVIEDPPSVVELENSVDVCGLYIIGAPDTLVEITIKHYDVNCETGGLLAFVDGWELNGEYFPNIMDHHRTLEERVLEFCNNFKQWPRLSNKKFFRSSQNAALLQYRIPVRGSFLVNVRFHKISQPCNILVHDTAALYNIGNFGYARNCSISALFPAAISFANLKIGAKNLQTEKPNYDCTMSADRLEVGGSSGLDSSAMEKSNEICGLAEKPGPEQAIFCGVSTVRLVSTGRYRNHATVVIRKADENDLDKATLVCSL